MLSGEIDTIYLGSVPVKGKTEKMKLFTVTSLLDDARIAEIRAGKRAGEAEEHGPDQAKSKEPAEPKEKSEVKENVRVA